MASSWYMVHHHGSPIMRWFWLIMISGDRSGFLQGLGGQSKPLSC
jgi:hypothetical protein